MPSETPVTEAGRRLLGQTLGKRITAESIVAIEAEARADAEAQVRRLHAEEENDQGQPWCMTCGDHWPCPTVRVFRAAALRETAAGTLDVDLLAQAAENTERHYSDFRVAALSWRQWAEHQSAEYERLRAARLSAAGQEPE